MNTINRVNYSRYKPSNMKSSANVVPNNKTTHSIKGSNIFYAKLLPGKYYLGVKILP
jgi:hypothetical protein